MSTTIFQRSLGVFMISVTCATFACGQIRLGLHGGVNISRLTQPEKYGYVSTWESRTYGVAGVVVDFHVSSHWLLATQINFIQKGMAIPNEEWGINPSGTTTFTANYFELPVRLRYRIGAPPLYWYIEGGVSLALLESARAYSVFNPDLGMPREERTMYVAGAYRQLEGSLVAGVGGEYSISDDFAVTLSAAYSWGLTNPIDGFWEGARSRSILLDCGILYTL